MPLVTECLDAACDLAEDLLLDAPMYDADRQIVPSASLLRIVQEVNAAIAAARSEG